MIGVIIKKEHKWLSSDFGILRNLYAGSFEVNEEEVAKAITKLSIGVTMKTVSVLK